MIKDSKNKPWGYLAKALAEQKRNYHISTRFLLRNSYIVRYFSSARWTPSNTNKISPWTGVAMDSAKVLLKRAYNSNEWAITSPPKPHSFADLPSQSKIFFI